MHKEFLEINQRPFPVPQTPWIMTQKWHQLLFCHWIVPEKLLRAEVPPQFELDLFNGQTWLGIIPFRVTGMRFRCLPPFPYISKYLELNIRTYVKYKGTPGIYFLSIDANKWMAVLGAKIGALLPYRYAQMKIDQDGDITQFHSNRGKKEKLQIQYQPTSPLFIPKQGSLEFWLFERYCFFVTKRNRVYRGDIHHDRWRVGHAEADFIKNTMASKLLNQSYFNKPSFHLAADKQVFAWLLRELN